MTILMRTKLYILLNRKTCSQLLGLQKKQNTHTGLTEDLKPQQIYPNCVGIVYGIQGYS